MELDFDKYCVVDGSPTTVLPPPPRRSKVSNRKANGKPTFENDVVRLSEDFTDITFNRYRSASCRDVRSGSVNRGGNEVLKRGSVYQSSKELRLFARAEADTGRRKIEVAQGSRPTFPLGIIDSLCSFDEDSSKVDRNMSSLTSIPEKGGDSLYEHQFDLRSRDSRDCSSYPGSDPMIASESVVSCINDGHGPRKTESAVNFNKSLSAKLALPHSPAQSESDSSKTSSPKSRFSPVLRIFDPFVKSKSQKSPLGCVKEPGTESIHEVIGINRSRTICRSLSNDLSENSPCSEYNSPCEKEESLNSRLDHSPTHLHALLRKENKHGVPFFEFLVKSPEEFYVAKTWKVENALTWVYTFHALRQGRKSNVSAWGSKDSNRESTLGQMHVSCHKCTESKGTKSFHDSMVTEFVLYDTAHPRRSTSSQDNTSNSTNVVKAPPVSAEISSRCDCDLNESSAKIRTKDQYKPSRNSNHSEKLHLRPVNASELHAEHEIAAITMQVPFEKRESLKVPSRDRTIDLCQLEGFYGSSDHGTMHLVIPGGNHSSPGTDNLGCPSPLLDRWRSGGGCDCGGWDLACPLNVFGNPNIQIAEGHPLIDEQHPAELFVQGKKDKLPAFSMRVVDDGKYAVDFHAQLSSLQAFSICIAILHASEASTAVGHERSKEMFQSDSLRVFPEDEIRTLIEDITAEEKKHKVQQKMEETLPSFVLNPPFSPIGRV